MTLECEETRWKEDTRSKNGDGDMSQMRRLRFEWDLGQPSLR